MTDADDRNPPHSCLDPDLGDLAMDLIDASDVLKRARDAAVFLSCGERHGRGGWPAMIRLACTLDDLVDAVILLPGPEIKAAIEAEYLHQQERREE